MFKALLVISLLLLLTTSQAQNVCDSCLNGSNCVNGKCACTGLYAGLQCEYSANYVCHFKDDKITVGSAFNPVTEGVPLNSTNYTSFCVNGGTCVEILHHGVVDHKGCVCQSGFEGDRCELVVQPSDSPSDLPSVKPSKIPSDVPSKEPSQIPSIKPSAGPSILPSYGPSAVPSILPSLNPTNATVTEIPSINPSNEPSTIPSVSIRPSAVTNNSTTTSFPSKPISNPPSISSGPSMTTNTPSSSLPGNGGGEDDCEYYCGEGDGFCIKEPPNPIDFPANFLWDLKEVEESCVCSEGFGGLNCEMPKQKCGDHYCYNNGECMDYGDGEAGCECLADPMLNEYMAAGEFCEHTATTFCYIPEGEPMLNIEVLSTFCTNEGKCSEPTGVSGEHRTCICPIGFTGDHCEIRDVDNFPDLGLVSTPSPTVSQTKSPSAVDTCSTAPCVRGECIHDLPPTDLMALWPDIFLDVPNLKSFCDCPLGFGGIKCEMPMAVCADGEHKCFNSGKCVEDSFGQFSCVCDESTTLFEGKYCQYEAQAYCYYDETSHLTIYPNKPGLQHFCVNGGVCSEFPSSICVCPPGLWGDHCEYHESGETSRPPAVTVPNPPTVSPPFTPGPPSGSANNNEGNNSSDKESEEKVVLIALVIGFVFGTGLTVLITLKIMRRRATRRDRARASTVNHDLALANLEVDGSSTMPSQQAPDQDRVLDFFDEKSPQESKENKLLSVSLA